MRLLKRAWPVALFAVLLGAMRWAAGGPALELPLKTLAVFAAAAVVVAAVPWARLLRGMLKRRRWFAAALFLATVFHFAELLARETGRVFTARSMAVARRYGPGWFRSLAWAAAAVFERTLTRAERFYAALVARGLGE